jgi:glycosyltransferase involved in cell wall biosynthesis
VIAPEQILAAPFDQALYRQLRAADQVKFLFVGRIARNKRQDRIMHLFDYYYREINRHSQLWLVGNYTPGSDYFKELQKLREELASGRQITFSGKIADEAVQAYYRAADVFVSASEHEGFGVPLLEAMVHGLPVVAFAATAVPETVNKGGILIQQWDSLRTAELINLLLKDQTWQTKLIAAQQHHLRRFSEDKVRQRLTAIVDFLCHGIESPFFTWRGPNLPHQNVSSSL